MATWPHEMMILEPAAVSKDTSKVYSYASTVSQNARMPSSVCKQKILCILFFSSKTRYRVRILGTPPGHPPLSADALKVMYDQAVSQARFPLGFCPSRPPNSVP